MVVSVTFPDDNPEAMTWQCQAVHFNQSGNPELSWPMLKKLAILCNKYEVSRALSPWSELWLQQWQASTASGEEDIESLCISYAFENERAFRHNSQNVVGLCRKKDVDEGRDKLSNFIIPENMVGMWISKRLIIPSVTVLDSLKARRQDYAQELLKVVESAMEAYIDTTCPRKLEHKKNHTPCERLGRAGHYLHELHSLGLWPLSEILEQPTSWTVEKLLEFQNYYLDDPENPRSMDVVIQGRKYHSHCKCPRSKMKERLQSAAEFCHLETRLCLKCVKDGMKGVCTEEPLSLCRTQRKRFGCRISPRVREHARSGGCRP